MFCALNHAITSSPTVAQNKFAPLEEEELIESTVSTTETKQMLPNDLEFLNGFAHKIQMGKKLSSGVKKPRGKSVDITTMIKPLPNSKKALDMIAKLCPQNCPMPSFILKFIYLNESHFYNDFTVEEGGLPRPECYHVGADLKSKPPKFIILQEVGPLKT